jgi:hypothetical protein
LYEPRINPIWQFFFEKKTPKLKNRQEEREKGTRIGFYFLASCIHLACQIPNTPNASTQNAVQRCKEFTKELTLDLFHVDGCALIASNSKRIIKKVKKIYPTV